MKRRDFSVTAASLAAAAAGSALGLPALAQGAPFKEGKDYAKLAKPVASTAAAGKVELVWNHTVEEVLGNDAGVARFEEGAAVAILTPSSTESSAREATSAGVVRPVLAGPRLTGMR